VEQARYRRDGDGVNAGCSPCLNVVIAQIVMIGNISEFGSGTGSGENATSSTEVILRPLLKRSSTVDPA
jgi:hypothetical protein